MAVLTGRVAIITGASRGIGAATARAMAAEGASLLLLARTRPDLEALAEDLRASGAAAEAMECDISDYAQLAAAVDHAKTRFGSVDIMVNNAAVIDPIGPLASSDPAAWARGAEISFTGMYFGIRAVLPVMRAQGSGVILNIGSGAAHNPLEGWSQYCASKAGAHMLMRCAHLENKGQGIRIISLSPGTVATDMQRRIRASGINPVSQMAFSDHAPPEHPARALVWLATEDAADLAGTEVSLRDPAMRARIGLD
jgi:NAD(P)-dependent dehydrogenase (short-subunit alcohol dehydrogenase family)